MRTLVRIRKDPGSHSRLFMSCHSRNSSAGMVYAASTEPSLLCAFAHPSFSRDRTASRTVFGTPFQRGAGLWTLPLDLPGLALLRETFFADLGGAVVGVRFEECFVGVDRFGCRGDPLFRCNFRGAVGFFERAVRFGGAAREEEDFRGFPESLRSDEGRREDFRDVRRGEEDFAPVAARFAAFWGAGFFAAFFGREKRERGLFRGRVPFASFARVLPRRFWRFAATGHQGADAWDFARPLTPAVAS
jgi:hypothetical protein